MRYLIIFRRLALLPALMRLLALILECISLVLLMARHHTDSVNTTSYLIVSLKTYTNLMLLSIPKAKLVVLYMSPSLCDH